MKEKIVNFLKKPKVILIFSVLCLTTLTVGFSYSYFFTIKSNQNNQTVTTGTLNVTFGYNNESGSIIKTDLLPMTDEEGMNQSENSIIHIQNTGTLAVNYVLNVGYDMDNYNKRSNASDSDKLTPLEYIRLAVYEYKGVNESTLILGPISLADLTVYEADSNNSLNNRYALLFDKLGSSSDAFKTYQVKMWLSSEATPYVSNSFFYVNSAVVAEADETKMTYNFTGIAKVGDSALADASVSIQNNSYKTTTNATGEFKIENLLPGTYKVEIKKDNDVYIGTITIKEGESLNINSNSTSFQGNGTLKLSSAAYTYGTTINNLKKANNIDSLSDSFVFESSKTYNVNSSFIITTGKTSDLGNLTFTLSEGKITSISN